MRFLDPMGEPLVFPEIHVVGTKAHVQSLFSVLAAERYFFQSSSDLIFRPNDTFMKGVAPVFRPFPVQPKSIPSAGQEVHTDLRLTPSHHSRADALVVVYDPLKDPTCSAIEAISPSLLAVGKPFIVVGLASTVSTDTVTTIDVTWPLIDHPLSIGVAPWFPSTGPPRSSTSESTDTPSTIASSTDADNFHSPSRARLTLPDGAALATAIAGAVFAPLHILLAPCHRVLSPIGSAAVARLFYAIDFDRDGALSRDELATFVRLVTPQAATHVSGALPRGGEVSEAVVDREVADIIALITGATADADADDVIAAGGVVTLADLSSVVATLLAMGDSARTSALWGALKVTGTRISGAAWSEHDLRGAVMGVVGRVNAPHAGAALTAAQGAAAAGRCGFDDVRARLVARSLAMPARDAAAAPAYAAAYEAAAARAASRRDGPGAGGATGLDCGDSLADGKLESTATSIYGEAVMGQLPPSAVAAVEEDHNDDDDDDDACAAAVPEWQSAAYALVPSAAAVAFLTRLAADPIWCDMLWAMLPGGSPFAALWADPSGAPVAGPIACTAAAGRAPAAADATGETSTIGQFLASWRLYMSVRDAGAFVRSLLCWGWTLPLDAALVAVRRRAARGPLRRGGTVFDFLSPQRSQPHHATECPTAGGVSDGLFVCLVVGHPGAGRRSLMAATAAAAPVGGTPSLRADVTGSVGAACAPRDGLLVSFARAHLTQDASGLTMHAPCVGGAPPAADDATATAYAVDIAFVLVDDATLLDVIGSPDGLVAAVDVALVMYDGNARDSFASVAPLQEALETHEALPTVYALAKLDLPLAPQDAVRPDEWCAARDLPWPPYRLTFPPTRAGTRSLSSSAFEGVATPAAELVAQLAVVVTMPSLALSNRAGFPSYTPAQKRRNRVILVRSFVWNPW